MVLFMPCRELVTDEAASLRFSKRDEVAVPVSSILFVTCYVMSHNLFRQPLSVDICAHLSLVHYPQRGPKDSNRQDPRVAQKYSV